MSTLPRPLAPAARRRSFAKDDSDSYLSRDIPIVIRRPAKGCQLPGSVGIFDTTDIESRSVGYDIVSPGYGMSSQMLELQNPGLLAFRGRADKLSHKLHSHGCERATSTIMPKQPVARFSLLGRPPLAKLRDPLDIPALEVSKRAIEEEKASLTFNDDPVAYFSKRKDGRGHRFIYLVHTGERSDPYFSPYDVEKVPTSGLKPEYFTMSATGVTYVPLDGNTETMSLDQWSRESSIFKTLRKLKFFKWYLFWKPFRKWMLFLWNRRYQELHDTITNRSFFKTRHFFAQALKLCDVRETADGFLKQYLLAIHSQKKYRLEEYEAINAQNTETLMSQFTDFIMATHKEIMQLYQVVWYPPGLRTHPRPP
jgi:hypothetical protein